MKILFLAPYPLKSAPSQRFRFEQYLNYLNESEIETDFQSFLDKRGWENIYKRGNNLAKVFDFIRGIARRKVKILLGLGTYDIVFIHRELTPIGPPFLEWWVAKVMKKKIVYDFDDAIWLKNTSPQNSIVKSLKWHRKVKSICKWAWKVSVGNQFLADFASQYNGNVQIIPTTIDTDYHVQDDPKRPSATITIGWTGSHSTVDYLNQIVPALNRLNESFDFRFLLISNQLPTFYIPNLEFRNWTFETEVSDLNEIDIGVMPLTDDDWAKGKCGFKALQFMALGKPIVASPVGVNSEIIDHEKSGLLADGEHEWFACLSELIDNEGLRKTLGSEGRRVVEQQYSVSANRNKYRSLFQIS